MKKGMEGINVVVILVVAIVVALAVVVFTTGTIDKGKVESNKSINNAGNSLQYNLCQMKCNNCKETTGCVWSTFQKDESGQNPCVSQKILESCS